MVSFLKQMAIGATGEAIRQRDISQVLDIQIDKEKRDTLEKKRAEDVAAGAKKLLADAELAATEKKRITDIATAKELDKTASKRAIAVKLAPDPASIRADKEAKIEAEAHKQDVAALKKRIKALVKAGVKKDDPLLKKLRERERYTQSPAKLKVYDAAIFKRETDLEGKRIMAAAKGSPISVAKERAIKEELGLRMDDVSTILDIPGFEGRVMNRNTGDLLPGVFNHKNYGQNISRLHRLILDTANTYSRDKKVSTIQGISYAIDTFKVKQEQINTLLDQYKEAQTKDDLQKLQELQNKRDPITRHPLIRYLSVNQSLKLDEAERVLSIKLAKERDKLAKEKEYNLESVDETGSPNIPDKQEAAAPAEKEKEPGMIDTAMGAVKTQARETFKSLAPETQDIARNIKKRLMSLINRMRQTNNQ